MHVQVWLARCEEVNAEVAIKIVKLDDPNIHLVMRISQLPSIESRCISFAECLGLFTQEHFVQDNDSGMRLQKAG